MRHKGLYTLTSIIIAALIGAGFELYRRRPIAIPSLVVALQAPLQPQSFVTAPANLANTSWLFRTFGDASCAGLLREGPGVTRWKMRRS